MKKNLLTRFGEAIDQHRQERQSQAALSPGDRIPSRWPALIRWFLPNGGTLLLIAILIFTQNVWAGQSLRNLAAESAASTGTIAYQGRLADSSGNPLTSTLNMSFRLYSAASGGTPLWTEQWTGPNGVKVSDGLFNVMLGSLTPIPQSVITGNSNLFLGITVGTDDEMAPRVQLGSVPFAVQALTVPDGSITAAKLAGDVSLVPPDGSITTAKIADGAVTTSKIANDGAEPSRIQNWSEDAFVVINPALTGASLIVDPQIHLTVPAGKAYYYVVVYQGLFGYNFGDRVGSSSSFYAEWNASLLANGNEIGMSKPTVKTGYRQDWSLTGGSSYWTVPYSVVWVARLEQGTYDLTVKFHGYSDNTMNKANLHRQRLQVMRNY